MTPWKYKRGLMRLAKITTTLDPMEREVLGTVAAIVADALMARARSAPKDELADMMGLSSGHKDAPTDPAMARLLPDFEREGDEEFAGDNALLRSLHETDIIKAKLSALQIITEQVGAGGSTEIALTVPEAHQFIAALNDLRLFVVSAQPATASPEIQEIFMITDQDQLVEWLAYCQESLLAVVAGD